MISIVTITFNNFEELKKTVLSVAGSSLDKVELIIVNGGHCSATRKFLEDLPCLWQKQHPSIGLKILQEPDQGIADAFNKGVSLAVGRGIIFLNSGDCLIDHSFIAWADTFLEKNPQVGFVHGDVIFEDAMCGEMRMKPRLCSLGRGMPYYHQTMVLRKEVFDRFGPHPFKLKYKIAMDFELVCRMEKMSIEGQYYPYQPIVRMDGQGVSAKREWPSIRECWMALRENNLIDGKNLWGYLRRLVFFQGRKILLAMKLRGLLIQLKKKKNASKANSLYRDGVCK